MISNHEHSKFRGIIQFRTVWKEYRHGGFCDYRYRLFLLSIGIACDYEIAQRMHCLILLFSENYLPNLFCKWICGIYLNMQGFCKFINAMIILCKFINVGIYKITGDYSAVCLKEWPYKSLCGYNESEMDFFFWPSRLPDPTCLELIWTQKG